MEFVKKDSKNKKWFALLPVLLVMLLVIILYMYQVLKHIETSLMLIWFPVLLACGESAAVGGQYWLVEKIQSSIRPSLQRVLDPFRGEYSVPFQVALVLLACDSCAEEPVRVPVPVRVSGRVPVLPMLLLAEGQPYHDEHQVDASNHSCCCYYCLVEPFCVVYAFLGGCSL